MRLAGVAVAVGGDQHLRLDLAEAVEHALDAEIRRARRPDRAEARGGEHRDDRLRHVRQVAGDPVAGADALGRAARPRSARPRRAARPRTARAGCRPRRRRRCAGVPSRRRSRFSAKFSRAPGEPARAGHRGRVLAAPPRHARLATTPHPSQTSRQNAAGSSTDHCHSRATASAPVKPWRAAMPAICVAAARSGVGCHSSSLMPLSPAGASLGDGRRAGTVTGNKAAGVVCGWMRRGVLSGKAGGFRGL